MRSLPLKGIAGLLFALIAFSAAGCDNDMRDRSRLKPYEKSAFFSDQRSSRPLVPGTVPRGFLREDDHLYRGKVEGQLAQTFPYPMDIEKIKRGRERYDIYCAACHDRVGTGRGMVVQRGFPKPVSFHDERIANSPPGYYFDIITNGFGNMPSYASQIKPEDRWAIIAYIRALQLSQKADLSVAPESAKQELLSRAPAS